MGGMTPDAEQVALTYQFMPPLLYGFPTDCNAVNCADAPAATVVTGAPVDELVTVTPEMATAAVMVMVAVPVRVVCACATAVIVTTLAVGTALGAVYTPAVLMKPFAAVPPATVFTCQFTSVLLKFRMVAVHCTIPLTVTELLLQETEMLGVAAVEEPQEFKTSSAGRSANVKIKYCQRALWAQI